MRRRLVVAAVALMGVPLVGAALAAGGSDVLDPGVPATPGLGRVGLSLPEVPEGAQRPVVLVLESGQQRLEVPTRSGGGLALDLPAGTWTVTAADGRACPVTLEVRAQTWSAGSVTWPASDCGPGSSPPADPGTERPSS